MLVRNVDLDDPRLVHKTRTGCLLRYEDGPSFTIAWPTRDSDKRVKVKKRSLASNRSNPPKNEQGSQHCASITSANQQCMSSAGAVALAAAFVRARPDEAGSNVIACQYSPTQSHATQQINFKDNGEEDATLLQTKKRKRSATKQISGSTQSLLASVQKESGAGQYQVVALGQEIECRFLARAAEMEAQHRRELQVTSHLLPSTYASTATIFSLTLLIL
jgi:hypothetical protein